MFKKIWISLLLLPLALFLAACDDDYETTQEFGESEEYAEDTLNEDWQTESERLERGRMGDQEMGESSAMIDRHPDSTERYGDTANLDEHSTQQSKSMQKNKAQLNTEQDRQSYVSNLEQSLDKIHSKMADARVKLGQLKEADQQEWSTLKSDLDQMVEEMEKSLAEVKKKSSRMASSSY